MKAFWKKHTFQFTFPAGTSKGVLLEKTSHFLILEKDGIQGIGECSTIPGLSPELNLPYTEKLNEVTTAIQADRFLSKDELFNFPSIAFGLEMANRDLLSGGKRMLFDTTFSRGETGIPINGLIWMGEQQWMEAQIRKKLDAGFRCLKMKIGALNFETEIEILGSIRKQFSPANLELRLDANGAFSSKEARGRLEQLAAFSIHSIEQPIRAGQWNEMAQLCETSPIPIALDEELTSVQSMQKKIDLLETIKPQYLILKPSMIGGFEASEEWIALAKERGIDWWITSALESNIGLNAIAQWTSSLKSNLRQGLGTGQLYENNFPSPLEIEGEQLFYRPGTPWNLLSLEI